MRTYTAEPNHCISRYRATRLQRPFWAARPTSALGYPMDESRAASTQQLWATWAWGGSGFTVGRSLTEAVTGIGDLLPMASLRWNFGVNNFMTYLTGNLTTGRYQQQRIANLGIGHNAIDAGGAYTYFDQKTGRE